MTKGVPGPLAGLRQEEEGPDVSYINFAVSRAKKEKIDAMAKRAGCSPIALVLRLVDAKIAEMDWKEMEEWEKTRAGGKA